MLQIISGDSLLTFIRYRQYLLTNLALLSVLLEPECKERWKKKKVKKWMREETMEG